MKHFFCILVFTLSSIACHAQLDSMSFTPVKDNSMFSESPTYSDGAGYNLFAGKTTGIAGSQIRRALLKFNLTSLPNNVQIQNIKLTMPVIQASGNTTTTHNFSLHKLLKDWGEGTSTSSGQGSPATTNDATWNYNFYNTSTWTSTGGDFTSTPSATSAVAYASFPLKFGTWNSTGMKNDVMAWLANPSTNFGWILRGEETVSGSSKKFTSREEGFFPKPTLMIYYTLPTVEKVLINEVNPQKKWIELYNPSNPSVNLNNYWLANGNATISLANLAILNGSLTLDSAKYVVLNWAGIGQNDGELALFNGNPSTAEMKDYVQYGSANHQRSSAAVIVQVWDNTNNFLPSISVDTLTFSLKGNNAYTSGKTTNSTSFVTQRQTPTYKNLLCPPNLALSGNIIDALYSTSGSLQIIGGLMPTSFSRFTSESFIQLNPNTLIEQGAKFQGQISGCLNN